MPVHCTIEPADCSAAELLLLAIGRAGVLSCRAILAEELDTLLNLLESVWKIGLRWGFVWGLAVIQALDVDRAEPWPDGQDREEDQALLV